MRKFDPIPAAFQPNYGFKLKIFHRKGVHLESLRNLSFAALCLILASCAAPAPGPVSETASQPEAPAEETVTEDPAQPEEELEIAEAAEEEGEDAEPVPSAWEQILAAQDNESARNEQLLKAAAALIRERRSPEAQEILNLIDAAHLSDAERVDRGMLEVRLAQMDGRHQRALRRLSLLARSSSLDVDQRIRLARLRAYSNSVLQRPVDLAIELVQLYSLLSADRGQQVETGHQLWATLSHMTMDELRDALGRTQDPIARQWYVLALALGLNSVRADPYKYSLAIQNWRRENPEHPANDLINAGLGASWNPVAKVALLLPLSSVNRAFVNALLDGFKAQHEADTNPLKPQIEVIDIGEQPGNATRFYYQAVDSGADFIVGPLGVGYVSEIVNYADFIVPTLLLGEALGSELPDYVFRFALAPEHEGAGIARRALIDGHVTALVIKSSEPWSERAFSAFNDEWQRLGGHILHAYDYELNQSDYSEAAKQVLLIDSSASRYQTVRTMMGQSMKFVPRRRQDVDFIYLSADSEHGRLLKPYLDFLKAHDLPIYSTSHIFPGDVNKIRDQDLNGIRFADMDWILDKSERMTDLKTALEQKRSASQSYDRLFAMGVDIYNLLPRIDVLSLDGSARFHGVTSIIRVAEDNRLLRSPRWAVFEDGLPVLIPGMADPELGAIPLFEPGPVPLPEGEKPE